MVEISSDDGAIERYSLLASIASILNPDAVQHLPENFHGISGLEDAATWLDKMLAESRIFAAQENASSAVIGFVFVHEDNQRQAFVGYVIDQDCWGRGFASELLAGFIEYAKAEGDWLRLLAGVDKENAASLHLLGKLGFTQLPHAEDEVSRFEYRLN